jgi:hypothetical protein
MGMEQSPGLQMEMHSERECQWYSQTTPGIQVGSNVTINYEYFIQLLHRADSMDARRGQCY